MYELYDPMTIMFFFRNKHMMCDFGTGNNNKLNWVLEDKQELIDIIETIYRGAKKGRGLVVSPKGRCRETLAAVQKTARLTTHRRLFYSLPLLGYYCLAIDRFTTHDILNIKLRGGIRLGVGFSGFQAFGLSFSHQMDCPLHLANQMTCFQEIKPRCYL